jgi:hypothetical protein
MQTKAVFPYSEGQEIEVKRSTYSNKAPALIGTMPDGEEYAVFSVNVVEHAKRLGQNQTFIKTYSEGEGNLEILQKMGIVGPVLFVVQTGFVIVPAVEVLMRD